MGSLSKKKMMFFSWILAIMLGVGCMFHTPLPVRAAVAYQGQGTQSSPYLVETAAQLNGMRNNLSAHYKLANTIDMSSFGAFEPIGYEGEKFTGSFTCDTNSDGTPKYAIKNLKVYIDAGEKYGHKIESSASYIDYVEGKNKWQAGLFGYTDDATIQNIAVLDNCTDKLIFSLTDDIGRMTPCDYSCPGDNSIILHFGRAIAGEAVVNCDGYNDTGLMPYDMYSYLPVIPFQGIRVDQ